jgi:hypothetical protein
MSYRQELAAEMAEKIKKQGFRVFLAERGTYGFYTDKEGSKIISFQVDGLRFSLSGNYKTSRPQNTGTGWRITEEGRGADFKQVFEAYPPYWAVGDAAWHYTTLDQHLDTYQSSSKYQEV